MPLSPWSSLSRKLLSQRISGPQLATVAGLVESPPLARLLGKLVWERMGIGELRGLPDSARTDIPLSAAPRAARPPRQPPDQRLGALPAPGEKKGPLPAVDLSRRFAAGQVYPTTVLCRLREATAALATRHRASPVLAPVPQAEAEAEAAAERYQKGQPLSPLDGVPISVKEQTTVAGLPARLGTGFLSAEPVPGDATVVRRLRRAGAVIAFQTPMTEYGASPLGVSAKRVLPENPHAAGHAAGGSSTGAAVAVARGLSPLALGGDGGGSVRIPAALCGVFGLKPTFGRLPRGGDLFSGTLGHLGPLGASAADLAAFLAIAAGPDEGDPASVWAPPDLAAQQAAWQGAVGRGVSGLRIGIDDRLWRRCDADVAHACMVALDRLCQEGAQKVALDLPLTGKSPGIGYLTFGAEMLAPLRPFLFAREMGPDLRLTLHLLSQLPFDGYVAAQRLRGGLRQEVAAALSGVDLVALPTTGRVAPALSEMEMQGLVDLELLDAMVRFTFLGNLTGLPALSAPVGFKQTASGARLPIGLQLIGDAWDEATVLAAAAHLERIGAATVIRPAGAVDLLQ